MLNHKSLQPDVALLLKSELVYQTICRHRAPLVISILLHFFDSLFLVLFAIDIYLSVHIRSVDKLQKLNLPLPCQRKCKFVKNQDEKQTRVKLDRSH